MISVARSIGALANAFRGAAIQTKKTTAATDALIKVLPRKRHLHRRGKLVAFGGPSLRLRSLRRRIHGKKRMKRAHRTRRFGASG